jgi:hypothetical protein
MEAMSEPESSLGDRQHSAVTAPTYVATGLPVTTERFNKNECKTMWGSHMMQPRVVDVRTEERKASRNPNRAQASAICEFASAHFAGSVEDAIWALRTAESCSGREATGQRHTTHKCVERRPSRASSTRRRAASTTKRSSTSSSDDSGGDLPESQVVPCAVMGVAS